MQQQTDADIDNLKLFPFTRNGRSIPQCCQLYWDFGEGFSEPESKKIEYEIDQWAFVSFSVIARTRTVTLRIDPCNQVGVAWVERIRVLDAGRSETLMDCTAQNGWAGLQTAGTASRIEDEDHLIIEANDQDPQILLPPLDAGEPGAEIAIEVSLKFLPFPMAVRHLLQTLGKRSGKAER